ncbi:redox-regulated ATPase YchF [archaeon]|nr:redox-regulated ATPase YchF [archaeon]
MKIGVVGKPSSGKSTFLNAATLVGAEMAAHPFTTIKPNLGTAYIRADCPCKSLGNPCSPRHGKCIDGQRFVPISLVDVAGLVPDAHKGKGMGNQFLSDLADADALIHVVDVSGNTDEQGNPTKNHDPCKDVDFLEREIEYWMLGILEKKWSQAARQVEMGTIKLHEFVYEQLSGLKVSEEEVKRAVQESGVVPTSSNEELLELVKEIRRRNKPIALAANKMDLPNAGKNYARLEGNVIVPCCAEAELALRKADEHELIHYVPGSSEFKLLGELPAGQAKALEFIRALLEKYGSTGVQECLERTVRELLGMIVVYPVEDEHKMCDKKGNVLPDAFLLHCGSTAVDLAFKVHSDIGEKFIGAIDCKTGRRVGKEHELTDGDIIKILV